MQRTGKQSMQPNELKAQAMRVLERNKRNPSCNTDATTVEKQCNFRDEIRGQKLREVAAKIIDVALGLGVKPELGLGFFTALDWENLAADIYGSDELHRCVTYAQKIFDQTQAGVRLVEVSEIEKIRD